MCLDSNIFSALPQPKIFNSNISDWWFTDLCYVHVSSPWDERTGGRRSIVAGHISPLFFHKIQVFAKRASVSNIFGQFHTKQRHFAGCCFLFYFSIHTLSM